MKQFTLLLFGLFLLSSGCGGDDDNRLTLIGRADGWRVASVSSDLESLADAAIAALTEEQLSTDSRTRADIQQQYDLRIARETQVDDCDKDEILFFIENGQMRIIRGNVPCPEPGDPNVLVGFNDNFYQSDFDATQLVFRTSGGDQLATYEVLELTSSIFRLQTERTVIDSLVPTLVYQVAYTLEAN
jgi:hypothetical protein